MEVIRLDSDQEAPELEDRVRLTMAGPEAWRWGGSVAFRREGIFKDCPDYCSTKEAAESDALEWAENNGVETFYVEIDDA